MKSNLEQMLQRQLLLHQQARQNSYPTTVKNEPKYRQDVPDDKVPFEVILLLLKFAILTIKLF